jgi:hypothetical protein
MAKLIRVLKATLKGPQRSSQRPTKTRPHRQGHKTSEGNQPHFQPRTGLPQGDQGLRPQTGTCATTARALGSWRGTVIR